MLSLLKRHLENLHIAREPKEVLAYCETLGVQIVPKSEFPFPLSKALGLPELFFLKGEASCWQSPSLAVVGARKASGYGIGMASRLSRDLSRFGLGVVSGLARGVDGAAHEAALRVGGKTIAILGSGFDEIYPREHEALAARIVEAGGLLVSEYPPGTPPLRHHFPRRNRWIAALSWGTIVVEARERSGSLITALCALEAGRDVFVVPGPVDGFDGGHALIQQGAKLTRGISDVLEELPSGLGLSELICGRLAMQPEAVFTPGFVFDPTFWVEQGRVLGDLWSAVDRGSVLEIAPQRFVWVGEIQT